MVSNPKAKRIGFQFTHPGKGATEFATDSSAGAIGFNSRTLGRVRLLDFIEGDTGVWVSIHAPWEGCDIEERHKEALQFTFQFTHPGKGAT